MGFMTRVCVPLNRGLPVKVWSFSHPAPPPPPTLRGCQMEMESQISPCAVRDAPRGAAVGRGSAGPKAAKCPGMAQI